MKFHALLHAGRFHLMFARTKKNFLDTDAKKQYNIAESQ